MKKKLKSKVVSHLKEDIKGYIKERKYLKDEVQEDKDLIKKVKKNERKNKKCSCKG